MSSPQFVGLDMFLVCGLNNLGQHCVAILKKYNVKVSAIDDVKGDRWEIPEIPDLLERLIVGDCRQASILEQAGIKQCRSILFVTENERVNIEAAFVARRINPRVRLIVRSGKQNFNEILSENLGNFVAFEPNSLSAHAFALTALGSEAIGYFTLEGQLLRVIEHQVQSKDYWCCGKPAHRLNLTTRCILSHVPFGSDPPQQFYDWDREAEVQIGDTLVYLEVAPDLGLSPQYAQRRPQWQWQKFFRGISPQKIGEFWQSYWQSPHQIRQIATIYAIAAIALWTIAIFVYRFSYPHITWEEAFYATAVLLLGGYGDLFGSVKFPSSLPPAESMPSWLRLFSLALTLTGQAFMGVLYALVTDALISSRLRFFQPEAPIPEGDRVILVGLNPLGQRVAEILQELDQPLVAIDSTAVDRQILPHVPRIAGNPREILERLHLSDARSIVLLGEDSLENLEIGLMARAIAPTIPIIIRAQESQFSDNIAPLFPYGKVLCGAALSAEVFACAAFGENVLNFFHLGAQIVMVTEYKIEEGDTLNGLLLSEIALGYGVVPILYQKYRPANYSLIPWEDVNLDTGDRLIVLATSQGLQRIEWGEMLPRLWEVRVEAILDRNAAVKGAEIICAIAGCDDATARQWIDSIPTVLPAPFYRDRARHLVRELRKVKILASAIEGNAT